MADTNAAAEGAPDEAPVEKPPSPKPKRRTGAQRPAQPKAAATASANTVRAFAGGALIAAAAVLSQLNGLTTQLMQFGSRNPWFYPLGIAVVILVSLYTIRELFQRSTAITLLKQTTTTNVLGEATKMQSRTEAPLIITRSDVVDVLRWQFGYSGPPGHRLGMFGPLEVAYRWAVGRLDDRTVEEIADELLEVGVAKGWLTLTDGAGFDDYYIANRRGEVRP